MRIALLLLLVLLLACSPAREDHIIEGLVTSLRPVGPAEILAFEIRAGADVFIVSVEDAEIRSPTGGRLSFEDISVGDRVLVVTPPQGMMLSSNFLKPGVVQILN